MLWWLEFLTRFIVYQEMFMNPLAWVNTTVYDFKSQLKSGSVTLNMWTYAEDSQSDDMLQYLGTVVANTSVDHATALSLTFRRYCLYIASTERNYHIPLQGNRTTLRLKYFS